jgi:RNA polymerase sigma factor (sigma-70 family)
VLVDDAESLDLLASSHSGLDDELHSRLYAAIAELNPEAAQTLVLRYIHNYSDAEIAKMLGTSRTVIAVRLFRSRARLRKILRRKS